MQIILTYPHPGGTQEPTRVANPTPEKLDELIAARCGYKLESENGELLDEWHPADSYQIKAVV